MPTCLPEAKEPPRPLHWGRSGGELAADRARGKSVKPIGSNSMCPKQSSKYGPKKRAKMAVD